MANRKGRMRRVKSNFHPTHETIKLAVEAFIKDGGKITKVESVSGFYEDFMSSGVSTYYVADGV